MDHGKWVKVFGGDGRGFMGYGKKGGERERYGKQSRSTMYRINSNISGASLLYTRNEQLA